jgi:hypothetical protein
MSLASDFPNIDPGKFRVQITLLQPVIGSDASGTVATYAPATPAVKAMVGFDYVRGTDIIKAGQDVSQVYVNMTGWWRPQFTPNCRVQTADGDQFIIQAVENVKRMNCYMVLVCLGIGSNN